MKKGFIFNALIVFLAVLVVFLYSIPISIYLKNKSLDFEKNVYLGGDNIVIDYLTSTDDTAITASNEYATIGTITYIEQNQKYGAVAHDLGTENLVIGDIFIVPVNSVIKSSGKKVGEKNVIYGFGTSSGKINAIESTGVYGSYLGDLNGKQLLEIGMPKEIEKSEALLYTNIDGNEVKAYKILIEKVYYARKTHNIYIKIIDEDLISKTGGIIQGMSGSPIVQNGKIIGALSHVDNDNVIYGYGLFITNMI